LLLRREDVDVNTPDDIGRTPLIKAADNAHKDVVRLLLEDNGLLVNARDKRGRTALYVAARKGHEAVVGLLLEVDNIDPNLGDTWYKWSPLAAAKSFMHEEVVRLLLEREDVDKTSMDVVSFRTLPPLSVVLGAEYEALRNCEDTNVYRSNYPFPIYNEVAAGRTLMMLQQGQPDDHAIMGESSGQTQISNSVREQAQGSGEPPAKRRKC
jgi:hypothetical protein